MTHEAVGIDVGARTLASVRVDFGTTPWIVRPGSVNRAFAAGGKAPANHLGVWRLVVGSREAVKPQSKAPRWAK